MYTYKLFNIENGYGYDILYNESIIIHQEYDPNKAGFDIMSKETAENESAVIIKRMEGEEQCQ